MQSRSLNHFPVFRIYLGIYLSWIFIDSLFSAKALWSREGIVPQASLNLTYGVFPNVLNYLDSTFHIKLFLIFLTIFSLFFAMGIQRRWIALFLWYGWTCLLNRNNLIINPSIHYIGWLLLACTLVPSGEKWSFGKVKEDWIIPPELLIGAWILCAIGYFLSGYDKLFSASWVDGTALQKIITGSLGSYHAGKLISYFPPNLIKWLTWSIIALEMLFLPLVIFDRTRKWAWALTTALHLGILAFLSIPYIALGMLSLHLFLLDFSWFDKTRNELSP